MERPRDESEGRRPDEREAAKRLARAQGEFARRVKRQFDLQFMQSPARWPRYPLLCLRHKREFDGIFARLALLHVKWPLVVFEANLYEVRGLTENEFLKRGKTYPSYQAILEDWDID